jgi:flagellin-like hook-associated protein FlgL
MRVPRANWAFLFAAQRDFEIFGTFFACNLSMARVTFTTMYNTTMRNLQLNAGKMNKIDEQVISQSKLNRPSDDPIGFTNAMSYRNILNSLKQQGINMDDGGSYLDVLETSFASMNNIFERCGELAVASANDTQKHQERLFTNMEIRENLEQLVSLAQTRHKEDYIFSGKWTNQPPYEIKNAQADYRKAPANVMGVNLPPLGPFQDTPSVTIQLFDSAYLDPNLRPDPDNPMVQRIIPGSLNGLNGLQEKSHVVPPDDPTVLADYEIDYVNGTITLLSENAKAAFYNYDAVTNTATLKHKDQLPNMNFEYIYRNSIDMSGEIYREVDTGITMKINSNPDDLFGKDGAGQTDSFKEIIALMQGLWYNDQAQISKGIDTVDAARKRNLTEQAIEGSKLNRIDIVYDRNQELKITNEDVKSTIEGVDLAEALTEFSLADAVYNASLQSAARLMQNSLLNYI